jgi:hypothetical protein
MTMRLLVATALSAGALALPTSAGANDIILCTGSIDGGGQTCVYESDVPVLKKYPDCWPLWEASAVEACRRAIAGP